GRQGRALPAVPAVEEVTGRDGRPSDRTCRSGSTCRRDRAAEFTSGPGGFRMQRVGYAYTLGQTVYRFPDLKDLLAKATPHRSGDVLAGIAAATAEQRMAARMALADLPLARLLEEAVVPYEDDEVTRLIADTHDRTAFAPVAHLAVGDFRNWLLADTTDAAALAAVAPGLTPEMAAAVSKLMR